MLSIPHYLYGFGIYIQTVVELALGFFEPTTVSESYDFLNFEKKHEGKTFQRYNP